MRYLAMKLGHFPTDPAVAYDNDRISEDWNDYVNVFGAAGFEQDPAKKRELSIAAFDKVCKLIETLRPFLEGKTSGFLFGDKLMSADFWMGNIYVSHCN